MEYLIRTHAYVRSDNKEGRKRKWKVAEEDSGHQALPFTHIFMGLCTHPKEKKIRVRKGTETSLDTRDAAVAPSRHITPGAHHMPSALKASAK